MKKSGMYRRTAVVMAAIFFLVGLSSCGSGGEDKSQWKEAYQEYVIGIMDANYLGEYDKYMEITGALQDEAERIYQANIQDFSLQMEDALSVRSDVVSLALTERFITLAQKIYSQTKYKAVDVLRDGENYTVSVEIEPIDFFGTVDEAFQSAVDKFNEQARGGEFDGYSDGEYEEAYGTAVIDALEQNVSDIDYEEAVVVDIALNYDEENQIYYISDEQMEALDDRVVKIVR